MTYALHAEPRVWTSTSGSTIEATFLGAYGEDYWFEAADNARFLKMPSKYISGRDVELVESEELNGILPADICDNTEDSVALWEAIYTSEATVLPEDANTLTDALDAIIAPLQPEIEEGSEASLIEIKFKKRKDGKSPLPDSLESGTIYEVMEQLLAPNELRFQILEGNILILRA